MEMSQTQNNHDPMSTMNMTPLIDVLLVLLIMFVITIPVATHAIEVDVGVSDTVIDVPDPVSNKIAISANDEIIWNGKTVTIEELATLLRVLPTLTPEPELQFEPSAQASYETSAKVLRLIRLSGVTNFGFVGNEKHREFDRPVD